MKFTPRDISLLKQAMQDSKAKTDKLYQDIGDAILRDAAKYMAEHGVSVVQSLAPEEARKLTKDYHEALAELNKIRELLCLLEDSA